MEDIEEPCSKFLYTQLGLKKVMRSSTSIFSKIQPLYCARCSHFPKRHTVWHRLAVEMWLWSWWFILNHLSFLFFLKKKTHSNFIAEFVKWFKVCHNKLCSHTVRGQTVKTCLGTMESKWNMAWSIKWLKWWWHFLDALREIRLLQKMEANKQHKHFSNREGCWSRCSWCLIDLTIIIPYYHSDNQMIIYSLYDINPCFASISSYWSCKSTDRKWGQRVMGITSKKVPSQCQHRNVPLCGMVCALTAQQTDIPWPLEM